MTLPQNIIIKWIWVFSFQHITATLPLMLGVMLNTLETQTLAEEMALSAKYDELSSAPRAHMIEGENRVRQAVL